MLTWVSGLYNGHLIQYYLYTVAPLVSSTCLSLPPPTNGGISYSDQSRSDGTVATYTCNTGYTLNGDSTRACGSGVWSGSAPICQSELNGLCIHCLFVECIVSHTANCPDLPLLINGMIMYSDGSTNNRPFLSSAVHSCNPGYTLTGGDTTRVCVSGGNWFGSPPTCQQRKELNLYSFIY